MGSNRPGNGAPSSANKHRFSKFPKTQRTLPAHLPRGLDMTGFVVTFIIACLVKKTSIKLQFF
ncbi:hypothetical protein CHCC14566_0551 [Bacillus licheniformis]|nr:hypothetical protein C6399_20535 [Bacillus licheniformis]TWN00804.1 hypothetical protein CHCC14566_0551 [Bacillus licheniformis]